MLLGKYSGVQPQCSRLQTGSKSSASSEYAERFAENDIKLGPLADLTDQDLKEIGVSLGHRRIMLRAIAELADADPRNA